MSPIFAKLLMCIAQVANTLSCTTKVFSTLVDLAGVSQELGDFFETLRLLPVILREVLRMVDQQLGHAELTERHTKVARVVRVPLTVDFFKQAHGLFEQIEGLVDAMMHVES